MYSQQNVITSQPIGEYTFEEYKELARAFHGYPAPGLLIGGYMVEKAKAGLEPGTLFEAVVETQKCLPDAVQLLTPCSIGNGWIRIVNLGRYALSLYDKYTGQGRRVWIDLDRLANWPEIYAWFLKHKAKKDQDTDALFSQIQQAGDAYLSTTPIQVQFRLLGKKSMGRIELCPICGEAFPQKDGAICRGCQGEEPYMHGKGVMESMDPEPRLRSLPVKDAVGKHALHDMTKIVPGQSKGPAFAAGQQIQTGDLCRLQQMGRTSVYVQEETLDLQDFVHENDAALAFARHMAGEGISYAAPPKEGKVNFQAESDGLLCLDVDRLEQFNLVPNVMCATRQNHIFVEKGKTVAGCRALPLYLSRQDLKKALTVLGDDPLFKIRQLLQTKIGILVTGTEVFQGLIQDKFAPIIKSKVEGFGSEIISSDVVPDDRRTIASSVQTMLHSGAELIITTAGLSVDPDDMTRAGLMDAGLSEILYGAPILPGAMTLLGRIGPARVLGVPACALFYKTTSLDLFLPMLLADVDITRRDLARMAEGGLCLNCKACTFPKCPFGK
ncbi:MAG: FmdE family protein [Desulfovermiculus sp.]|nr:FmdE family protein [Desulfovermiculus sp.]